MPTSSTDTPAPPRRLTRIPDPAEPVPPVAWPTLALLVAAVTIATVSSTLALTAAWPVALSIAANAVAAYLAFTVLHDASHHAAAGHHRLNAALGRIAAPMLSPVLGFSAFRFIHMQHHRFTNHADGRDPDRYSMDGRSWQRPIRWATLDLYYVHFYSRHLARRPRRELIEMGTQSLLAATVFGGVIATGFGPELLLLCLVPQRIALIYLAWAFDYLPHHRLHHTPGEDRFKATRNRIGGERWVSPLMLYQNYHLVHHLHPVVPFYRYLVVWRRNETAYLDGDPALSTLRGRPITAEEYRSMRDLVDHHA